MTDKTYQPKVYKTSNGDKLVIANGGEIDIESGGAFKINGTQVTASAEEINKLDGVGQVVASGTQVAKINDPTGGTTIDSEARAAINAIIDALEAFGISASS